MAEATNTFEGGSDETTISTVNSGGGSGTAFDTVYTDGSTPVVVFDTARAAHGSYSARLFNNSGGATRSAYLEWTSAVGTPTTVYGRFYVYSTGWDVTARTILARFASLVFIEVQASTGLWWFRDNSGFSSASSSTVSANKWVRFEYKIVYSATVGEFTVRYFDTADSATPTQEISLTTRDTGTAHSYSRFGPQLANNDTTFWLDGLVAGAADWPGPVAADLTGTIQGTSTLTATLSQIAATSFTVIPVGDGSNSLVYNQAGTTTDLYLSVDDDPDSPDTSDYIFTKGVDGYQFFDMSATPGDFGSIFTLQARVAIRNINPDPTVNLYGQVFASDESTPYTGEVVLATDATADGLTETVFTLLAAGLSAGKGGWDAATFRLRWDFV